MKKTMLGFAACALILSSCSQNEELVDNSKLNQEEIKFTPYVNKTKASVTNLDAMKNNTDGFRVFAVQHTNSQTGYQGLPVFMNSLKVAWSTPNDLTNGIWSYGDSKYYWPETDALSFFAIAPNNGKVGGFTQGTSITVPITIQDDVKEQIDILAASAIRKSKEDQDAIGGRVDFTFKHILSRIGFKAKVKENDNLKFKINKVSYKYGEQISKQGELSFDNSDNVITIANKSGNTDFHINEEEPYSMTLPAISLNNGREHIIEGATTKPIHGLSSYLMILPQNLSGKTFVTLTIKYQIAVAGDVFETEKTATVLIPGMNYLMGKAYTHNLIFSGSGSGMLEVKFGVTDVEDWVNDTTQPSDTNVPNPTPSN